MTEGFKRLSLDSRHLCSTVRQHRAGIGHKRSEHTLCAFQVIRTYAQTVGQPEVIKLSGMTNTSTAILRMDCFYLNVIKAVLTYVETFDLQQEASFVETRITDIVENMIPHDICRISCVRLTSST